MKVHKSVKKRLKTLTFVQLTLFSSFSLKAQDAPFFRIILSIALINMNGAFFQ